MPDSTAGAKAPAFPWVHDPVGYLIAPNDPRDFFARIYEKEPLLISREDRARYRLLLSVDAIDALVASADLRRGQIDVVNAINPVAPDAYILSDGLIDRGVVAREYQRGSTLILQQLQQADSTLAQFCRALEHVFSAHTQTNIYITPPNSQGFKTHYDNHDVFVLQIQGSKTWRLYNTPIETPYRGEDFQPGEHEVGAITREFVLNAGDCVYIPRGLMHDASTAGDEPSLHVTVGLFVRTWADLMIEAASEVAVSDADFRRSLPPGHTHGDFDREAVRAHFKMLAAKLADAQMDSAFQLLVDGFIRTRTPDTSGALSDGPRAFTPEDRFQLRAFAPFRIADDEGKIVVIAPGGDVDFGAADRPALERALDGTPFAMADLGPAGDIILRNLQAFGLVERL